MKDISETIENNCEDVMKEIITEAVSLLGDIREEPKGKPAVREPKNKKVIEFLEDENDSPLTAEIKRRVNEGNYTLVDLIEYFMDDYALDAKAATSRANNRINGIISSNNMTDKSIDEWLGFLKLNIKLVPR